MDCVDSCDSGTCRHIRGARAESFKYQAESDKVALDEPIDEIKCTIEATKAAVRFAKSTKNVTLKAFNQDGVVMLVDEEKN